jgi:hypothetical protein
MTGWKKKILDAFISHYFASAPETGEDRVVLRLRSSLLFPDFDTIQPGEKESYLEAAESLERKGIISLRWEKRNKGERLKTLSCENFEKLFEEAEKPFPKAEAEKIRGMLSEKVIALKESFTAKNKENSQTAEKVIALLEFLSIHFGPREIGQGIDLQTTEELVRLLEFMLYPAKLEKITTRALSILLYRDSKRLENLLSICSPLLSRAQKNTLSPDLSFLERSFPETKISGKIIIEFKNSKPPMVNASGCILGLPLESAEEIEAVKLLHEKKEKTVLTIENKETFYALAHPQKRNTNEALSRFDCFLYAGGYSNRAAAAMIKILTASNFSFYHAGDLDPDGILILQHIQELAERPVTPLLMNAATFDKYLPWARKLTKPMLAQIKKINNETRVVPELAGLLRRIEETGMGVEQEIVDYR